jgi:hypothetical protein
MGLDKPFTKCGNCERESNISRLYVEMGVQNTKLLSFFSTTSPALVMGRNRPHLPARRRRDHRPAEYRVTA